jgi:hypothetical protein
VSPGAATWVAALATIAIVALVVGVHYEVLSACTRYLRRLCHQHRPRVLILIFIMIVTHATAIWVFALGYALLLRFEGLGALTGHAAASLGDYAYFSGMVYTTVGFGDIVPTGPIRILSAMEALTGLVMITWSASFTFLEMQRDWPLAPAEKD